MRIRNLYYFVKLDNAYDAVELKPLGITADPRTLVVSGIPCSYLGWQGEKCPSFQIPDLESSQTAALLSAFKSFKDLIRFRNMKIIFALTGSTLDALFGNVNRVRSSDFGPALFCIDDYLPVSDLDYNGRLIRDSSNENTPVENTLLSKDIKKKFLRRLRNSGFLNDLNDVNKYISSPLPKAILQAVVICLERNQKVYSVISRASSNDPSILDRVKELGERVERLTFIGYDLERLLDQANDKYVDDRAPAKRNMSDEVYELVLNKWKRDFKVYTAGQQPGGFIAWGDLIDNFDQLRTKYLKHQYPIYRKEFDASRYEIHFNSDWSGAQAKEELLRLNKSRVEATNRLVDEFLGLLVDEWTSGINLSNKGKSPFSTMISRQNLDLSLPRVNLARMSVNIPLSVIENKQGLRGLERCVTYQLSDIDVVQNAKNTQGDVVKSLFGLLVASSSASDTNSHRSGSDLSFTLRSTVLLQDEPTALQNQTVTISNLSVLDAAVLQTFITISQEYEKAMYLLNEFSFHDLNSRDHKTISTYGVQCDGSALFSLFDDYHVANENSLLESLKESKILGPLERFALEDEAKKMKTASKVNEPTVKDPKLAALIRKCGANSSQTLLAFKFVFDYFNYYDMNSDLNQNNNVCSVFDKSSLEYLENLIAGHDEVDSKGAFVSKIVESYSKQRYVQPFIYRRFPVSFSLIERGKNSNAGAAGAEVPRDFLGDIEVRGAVAVLYERYSNSIVGVYRLFDSPERFDAKGNRKKLLVDTSSLMSVSSVCHVRNNNKKGVMGVLNGLLGDKPSSAKDLYNLFASDYILQFELHDEVGTPFVGNNNTQYNCVFKSLSITDGIALYAYSLIMQYACVHNPSIKTILNEVSNLPHQAALRSLPRVSPSFYKNRFGDYCECSPEDRDKLERIEKVYMRQNTVSVAGKDYSFVKSIIIDGIPYNILDNTGKLLDQATPDAAYQVGVSSLKPISLDSVIRYTHISDSDSFPRRIAYNMHTLAPVNLYYAKFIEEFDEYLSGVQQLNLNDLVADPCWRYIVIGDKTALVHDSTREILKAAKKVGDDVPLHSMVDSLYAMSYGRIQSCVGLKLLYPSISVLPVVDCIGGSWVRYNKDEVVRAPPPVAATAPGAPPPSAPFLKPGTHSVKNLQMVHISWNVSGQRNGQRLVENDNAIVDIMGNTVFDYKGFMPSSNTTDKLSPLKEASIQGGISFQSDAVVANNPTVSLVLDTLKRNTPVLSVEETIGSNEKGDTIACFVVTLKIVSGNVKDEKNLTVTEAKVTFQMKPFDVVTWITYLGFLSGMAQIRTAGVEQIVTLAYTELKGNRDKFMKLADQSKTGAVAAAAAYSFGDFSPIEVALLSEESFRDFNDVAVKGSIDSLRSEAEVADSRSTGDKPLKRTNLAKLPSESAEQWAERVLEVYEKRTRNGHFSFNGKDFPMKAILSLRPNWNYSFVADSHQESFYGTVNVNGYPGQGILESHSTVLQKQPETRIVDFMQSLSNQYNFFLGIDPVWETEGFDYGSNKKSNAIKRIHVNGKRDVIIRQDDDRSNIVKQLNSIQGHLSTAFTNLRPDPGVPVPKFKQLVLPGYMSVENNGQCKCTHDESKFGRVKNDFEKPKNLTVVSLSTFFSPENDNILNNIHRSEELRYHFNKCTINLVTDENGDRMFNFTEVATNTTKQGDAPSTGLTIPASRLIGLFNYSGIDSALYPAPECWQSRIFALRFLPENTAGGVIADAHDLVPYEDMVFFIPNCELRDVFIRDLVTLCEGLTRPDDENRRIEVLKTMSSKQDFIDVSLFNPNSNNGFDFSLKHDTAKSKEILANAKKFFGRVRSGSFAIRNTEFGNDMLYMWSFYIEKNRLITIKGDNGQQRQIRIKSEVTIPFRNISTVLNHRDCLNLLPQGLNGTRLSRGQLADFKDFDVIEINPEDAQIPVQFTGLVTRNKIHILATSESVGKDLFLGLSSAISRMRPQMASARVSFRSSEPEALKIDGFGNERYALKQAGLSSIGSAGVDCLVRISESNDKHINAFHAKLTCKGGKLTFKSFCLPNELVGRFDFVVNVDSIVPSLKVINLGEGKKTFPLSSFNRPAVTFNANLSGKNVVQIFCLYPEDHFMLCDTAIKLIKNEKSNEDISWFTGKYQRTNSSFSKERDFQPAVKLAIGGDSKVQSKASKTVEKYDCSSLIYRDIPAVTSFIFDSAVSSVLAESNKFGTNFFRIVDNFNSTIVTMSCGIIPNFFRSNPFQDHPIFTTRFISSHWLSNFTGYSSETFEIEVSPNTRHLFANDPAVQGGKFDLLEKDLDTNEACENMHSNWIQYFIEKSGKDKDTIILKASYEGEYSNGQFSGFGILKYMGAVYTGYFDNGLFNGRGSVSLDVPFLTKHFFDDSPLLVPNEHEGIPELKKYIDLHSNNITAGALASSSVYHFTYEAPPIVTPLYEGNFKNGLFSEFGVARDFRLLSNGSHLVLSEQRLYRGNFKEGMVKGRGQFFDYVNFRVATGDFDFVNTKKLFPLNGRVANFAGNTGFECFPDRYEFIAPHVKMISWYDNRAMDTWQIRRELTSGMVNYTSGTGQRYEADEKDKNKILVNTESDHMLRNALIDFYNLIDHSKVQQVSVPHGHGNLINVTGVPAEDAFDRDEFDEPEEVSATINFYSKLCSSTAAETNPRFAYLQKAFAKIVTLSKERFAYAEKYQDSMLSPSPFTSLIENHKVPTVADKFFWLSFSDFCRRAINRTGGERRDEDLLILDEFSRNVSMLPDIRRQFGTFKELGVYRCRDMLELFRGFSFITYTGTKSSVFPRLKVIGRFSAGMERFYTQSIADRTDGFPNSGLRHILGRSLGLLPGFFLETNLAPENRGDVLSDDGGLLAEIDLVPSKAHLGFIHETDKVPTTIVFSSSSLDKEHKDRQGRENSADNFDLRDVYVANAITHPWCSIVTDSPLVTDEPFPSYVLDVTKGYWGTQRGTDIGSDLTPDLGEGFRIAKASLFFDGKFTLTNVPATEFQFTTGCCPLLFEEREKDHFRIPVPVAWANSQIFNVNPAQDFLQGGDSDLNDLSKSLRSRFALYLVCTDGYGRWTNQTMCPNLLGDGLALRNFSHDAFGLGTSNGLYVLARVRDGRTMKVCFRPYRIFFNGATWSLVPADKSARLMCNLDDVNSDSNVLTFPITSDALLSDNVDGTGVPLSPVIVPWSHVRLDDDEKQLLKEVSFMQKDYYFGYRMNVKSLDTPVECLSSAAQSQDDVMDFVFVHPKDAAQFMYTYTTSALDSEVDGNEDIASAEAGNGRLLFPIEEIFTNPIPVTFKKSSGQIDMGEARRVTHVRMDGFRMLLLNIKGDPSMYSNRRVIETFNFFDYRTIDMEKEIFSPCKVLHADIKASYNMVPAGVREDAYAIMTIDKYDRAELDTDGWEYEEDDFLRDVNGWWWNNTNSQEEKSVSDLQAQRKQFIKEKKLIHRASISFGFPSKQYHDLFVHAVATMRAKSNSVFPFNRQFDENKGITGSLPADKFNVKHSNNLEIARSYMNRTLSYALDSLTPPYYGASDEIRTTDVYVRILLKKARELATKDPNAKRTMDFMRRDVDEEVIKIEVSNGNIKGFKELNNGKSEIYFEFRRNDIFDVSVGMEQATNKERFVVPGNPCVSIRGFNSKKGIVESVFLGPSETQKAPFRFVKSLADRLRNKFDLIDSVECDVVDFEATINRQTMKVKKVAVKDKMIHFIGEAEGQPIVAKVPPESIACQRMIVNASGNRLSESMISWNTIYFLNDGGSDPDIGIANSAECRFSSIEDSIAFVNAAYSTVRNGKSNISFFKISN